MIISASRRTDIPAFFSDWFFNRIEEQYAYVRNPINTHQVSRIDLSPDVVDCIVFWSKNPKPMLPRLNQLRDYMYYFQFTLNAYEQDMEQRIPALQERIDTFRTLAELLGKQRIIWRYDPIIVNAKYSIDRHIKQYAHIADQLCGYTEQSIISFVDLYPGISSRIKKQDIHTLTQTEKTTLAKELSVIAHAHDLTIETCAEDIDLSACRIEHARCIDDRLIARLLGCSLDVGKDKNQRLECGCVSGIDLGSYDTCQNDCVYCYANHNPAVRRQNLQAYAADSPLLCSHLTESDKVTQRKMNSLKEMQLKISIPANPPQHP